MGELTAAWQLLREELPFSVEELDIARALVDDSLDLRCPQPG
jgi:hypothetical protein